MKDQSKVENLVFAGASFLGVAYPGAIQALHETAYTDGTKCIDSVLRVAGNSIGSLIASVVAMGVEPEYAKQFAADIDLPRIFSNEHGKIAGMFNAVAHGGIGEGEYFITKVKEAFTHLCGNGNITFAELEEMRAGNPTIKELHIVVTNLSRRCTEVFNATRTPNLRIAEAVRMSVSQFALLTPVEYNGCFYVDGGVMRNYPVNLFDYTKYIAPNSITKQQNIYEINHATIGFTVESQALIDSNVNDTLPPIVHNIKDDASLFKAKWDCMMAAGYGDERNEAYRTIFVPSLGISGFDINITHQQKMDLMLSGYEATKSFLDDRNKGAHRQARQSYLDIHNEQEIDINGIRTHLGREERRRLRSIDQCCVLS